MRHEIKEASMPRVGGSCRLRVCEDYPPPGSEVYQSGGQGTGHQLPYTEEA